MIIELIAYELVTTAGGLLGLKALSGANVSKQMIGINGPKPLPIIDSYLKRQVGHVSKREAWLSTKAVKTINRLSQYQAFKYILVLAGRKAREYQLAQGGHRNSRNV